MQQHDCCSITYSLYFHKTSLYFLQNKYKDNRCQMSCANNLIIMFVGFVCLFDWLVGLVWFGFCSTGPICLNFSKSQKLPFFLENCPLETRAETFLDKNPFVAVFPCNSCTYASRIKVSCPSHLLISSPWSHK